MKFIHLSDLHLGIRLNEYSMIEDQKYILDRIMGIIEMEKPDCIFIAGDIYDKTVPPAEAVAMFDDFISRIAERNIHTFIISGNHDSAERIAFGSRIMDGSGIHFSPVYSGNISPIVLEDGFGSVNIYMLPFVRPSTVRAFYPDDDTEGFSAAVETAVRHLNINISERNILITHQFVAGALRSDSEDISVGGADCVSAEIFGDFDYVALGHIHSPQNIGSERIRYCGTPLKYSFSEAGQKKSVTVGELSEKGMLTVRTEELIPLRDMIELKGSYNMLMSRSFYEGTGYTEAYVKIILTDEEDIPDAVNKLRIVYRNMMKMDYDNERTRRQNIILVGAEVRELDPVNLFGRFFEEQNNLPMSDEQADFAEDVIREVWTDK